MHDKDCAMERKLESDYIPRAGGVLLIFGGARWRSEKIEVFCSDSRMLWMSPRRPMPIIDERASPRNSSTNTEERVDY